MEIDPAEIEKLDSEILDYQDYANTLIPTMRSWSETVFKTALQNRNDQEINKIVDDFYNSYQDEVSSDPHGHAMDYIHIVMDIEKK